MQLSFSKTLEGGRAVRSIGRIKISMRWRAADTPGSEAERAAAIAALKREAEDYGADAIVDIQFETDGVRGIDIDGVPLQRVTVSGLAVRYALAA